MNKEKSIRCVYSESEPLLADERDDADALLDSFLEPCK